MKRSALRLVAVAGVALAVALLLSAAGRPMAAAADAPGTWPADKSPLPEGAVLRFGSGRFRHAGAVSAVAFSPDGKLLASAGQDALVRLWEVSTGKQVRAYARFYTGVTALAFSPDGDALAATEWGGGFFGRGVHILDVSGGPERIIEAGRQGGAGGAPIAYSHDGKVLASGNSEGQIVLWEVATGRALAEMKADPASRIRAFAFSADGKSLAASDVDGKVCLWDVAGRKLLHSLRSTDTWVWPVAFSPDGRWLLSGGGTKEKPAVPLSPDRRCCVRVWDRATGKALHVLRGPETEAGVYSLAVSPDGRTLAVGGLSQASLWDLKTRKPIRVLSSGPNRFQRVVRLCFSPDGKLLAGAAGHAVRLWDTGTGRLLSPGPSEAAGGLGPVVLSRDGKALAAGDVEGNVLLWDFPAGRLRHRWVSQSWRGGHVALTTDGSAVAAASSDGTVRVWNTATGRQLHALQSAEKSGQSKRLAFSPDGKLLASSYCSSRPEGGPRGVHLWGLTDGKLRQDLRTEEKAQGRFLGLAFSGDGRHLWATADDGQTYRWRAAGERFTSAGDITSDPHLIQVAYSPTDWLAEARPELSGTVLRNLRSKRRGALLPAPAGFSGVRAFSPDGRYLALATGFIIGGDPDLVHDRTLRVYEVVSGRELLRRDLPADSGVGSLTYAPDGRRLITAMWGSTVLVWDVLPGAGGAARPLPALWADLESADVWKAHRAAAGLEARGDAAVTFLAGRVRPTPAAEATRLAKLIADLDDTSFEVRERASRTLSDLGPVAALALERAETKASSAEARRRIGRLLEECGAPVLPPALWRPVRAVEVLEHIGTKEARALLHRLSEGGTDLPLTAEAMAALQRLAKRPPQAAEKRSQEP